MLENVQSRFVLPLVFIAALVLFVSLVGLTRGDGTEPASSPMAGQSREATSMPLVTRGKDAVYGVPMVVRHPNNVALAPYSAKRKNMKVRYVKPLFSNYQPDLFYIPDQIAGKTLFRWQTSKNGGPGLEGVYPGNILTLLDNEIYDFGVSARFVKVRNETTGHVGYVTVELLIGETEPIIQGMWPAKNAAKLRSSSLVTLDGVRIYAIHLPNDLNEIRSQTASMADPQKYPIAFSGGKPGVHPVTAANVYFTNLAYTLKSDAAKEDREAIVKAAQVFFDNYVVKGSVTVAPGIVSWPYHFDWTMNWGIKLEPPWYSAYANARIAEGNAVLYALTGKDIYADWARKASKLLLNPISKGGSLYEVSGFRLPAEYIYDVQSVPNVRVLDGELIAVTSLCNTARLLQDSGLLRECFAQGAGLAMQLEWYRKPDGSLLFASYVENMPPHYNWILWSNLIALGNIMKDRRFIEAASAVHDHIPEDWCERNGC